jgi:hypothetical protein
MNWWQTLLVTAALLLVLILALQGLGWAAARLWCAAKVCL